VLVVVVSVQVVENMMAEVLDTGMEQLETGVDTAVQQVSVEVGIAEVAEVDIAGIAEVDIAGIAEVDIAGMAMVVLQVADMVAGRVEEVDRLADVEVETVVVVLVVERVGWDARN
jgi:hypothetical protein